MNKMDQEAEFEELQDWCLKRYPYFRGDALGTVMSWNMLHYVYTTKGIERAKEFIQEEMEGVVEE